jgi:phage terminase large subunit
MSSSTLRVEIPRKLLPLLQPKRYKGAYGGRGGAKSHFFAEQIIIKCYNQPTRVVCIREVQNSIKDSVKQLLQDKIAKLGLNFAFETLESEIRCNNGSIIIFKGMQSYNADNIKSLEGYDLAWIEEAQTLSQHSLDLLRPTLRKENSELWFSWNPRYKTDAVDKFFRKQPPADAISVMVNWRDNPWFPEVLRKEMEHDFLIDEDKADHIWNGAYGAGQGAILARYVNKAEREGRIGVVAYDPEGSPIEVSSDLGFRDTSSWWYWQRKQGGFSLLMYDGDSGLDADDWIQRIQNNLIVLSKGKVGKIWLPHDAKAKTFQSKYSSIEQFLKAFGTGKVGVVPQTKKSDQINAARTIISKCEFDEKLCEEGLDGLRAWEYQYNEENGVFSREPLHNWASHPSDAFAYGCQVMQESPAPEKDKEPEYPVKAINDTTIQLPPLNDMWEQSKQSNRRI